MSLFQCARCGCVENTAGNCSNYWTQVTTVIAATKQVPKHDVIALARHAEARTQLALWRDVGGIAADAAFGPYCSVCSQVWFTKEGRYGTGPNPDAKWHGNFPRRFLPKGQFVTGAGGDLVHKVTGASCHEFWLEKEEGT